MKLSILIPTITGRSEMFFALTNKLKAQADVCENKVQIKYLLDDGVMPIGEKRNCLLYLAKGEYVAFVDDDDDVSENYIDLLMEGINKGVDCCSLKGEYSVDGVFDGIFEHSIKYNKWETVEGEIKYLRMP